jgi:hypothetical protein
MFKIEIDFEKEKNFVNIDMVDIDNNIYKQELKYPIDFTNPLFKPISYLVGLRVLELEQNRYSDLNNLQYILSNIEQFDDYLFYLSEKIEKYLEEEYIEYKNKSKDK